MSRSKKDRLFPINSSRITDTALAELVAAALRQDYGDLPSAVKQIGLRTGANLRAIKNWYEARHAPSSGHLLTLARSSPSLLKLVLKQVGGDDLFDAFQLLGGHGPTRQMQPDHVPINVPINSGDSLNERQNWFLEELKDGSKRMARDIAGRWNVALKTAQRDIANLKGRNLIIYKGSKKSGRYILI
jgi:hypothetical protein